MGAVHAGKPFGTVIVDRTLAVDQDCLHALQMIREVNQDVQVILMSADTDDPVFRNCHAYGFSAALRKPCTRKQIEEALHAGEELPV
jgi:DNA-binding NarL/FixJ family response regulator